MSDRKSDRNVDYSEGGSFVNAYTLSRLGVVLFATSGTALASGVDWRLCLAVITLAIVIPCTYSTRRPRN